MHIPVDLIKMATKIKENLKRLIKELRQVNSSKEVKKIYEEIQKREEAIKENYQSWKRRYGDHIDRIKTGSLFDIADVLLSLIRKK